MNQNKSKEFNNKEQAYEYKQAKYPNKHAWIYSIVYRNNWYSQAVWYVSTKVNEDIKARCAFHNVSTQKYRLSFEHNQVTELPKGMEVNIYENVRQKIRA